MASIIILSESLSGEGSPTRLEVATHQVLGISWTAVASDAAAAVPVPAPALAGGHRHRLCRPDLSD